MNPSGHDAAVEVTLADLIAMRLRAHRFAHAVKRVSSNLAATHESRFRGRGVDYVESRNYQPGDDIRQMDWRVTARTGRPHTKLFQEEREHNNLIIVDFNPSMRFGTRQRFKTVQAARTAALLAWAAVLGGDRVGALGFGPQLDAEIKPGGGPRGALRVLHALTEWDQLTRYGKTTAPLSAALSRARRLARPGSRVLILSDGFCADAEAEASLAHLSGHCDVAAVLLADALEHAAPPPARYALRSESGRIMLDFTAVRLRQQWAKLFEQRRAPMIEMLNRRGLRWVSLKTDAEPESALTQLLGLAQQRASMRSRRA